jgi:hypothetical protein
MVTRVAPVTLPFEQTTAGPAIEVDGELVDDVLWELVELAIPGART